jgi:hypothetical protein
MLAQDHRGGVMSIVSRIVAALVLTLCVGAHAGKVDSTYTSLGGNQWSVAFTVTNTGEPAPVSEFTVYFAEGLFANLSVTGSPGTWDSIVIQPDSGLPADGFFDALVLDQADALDNGESQSGFSMTFDFLGTGAPGALLFDFLDADFQLLSTGRTTVPDDGGGGGGTVPEPSAMGLVLLGLCAATRVRRSERANVSRVLGARIGVLK